MFSTSETIPRLKKK